MDGDATQGGYGSCAKNLANAFDRLKFTSKSFQELLPRSDAQISRYRKRKQCLSQRQNIVKLEPSEDLDRLLSRRRMAEIVHQLSQCRIGEEL
ncbi:MAG: hypothetical protein WBE94_05330 [Pseudolabrys sp.]